MLLSRPVLTHSILPMVMFNLIYGEHIFSLEIVHDGEILPLRKTRNIGIFNNK